MRVSWVAGSLLLSISVLSASAQDATKRRNEIPNGDTWTRAIEDRSQRGTLHDAYQFVRGDSGKWNDEASLQHAPPLARKPEKLSLDDWYDLLERTRQRPLTPADDNWLLMKTRQLDDNDRVWIERIERKGNRFTVVMNEAIWQGRYSKTFTYYGVHGVNLGELEPGDYEATWIINPLAFKQFDGDGRPNENWPKDEQPDKKKPLELNVSFSVVPSKPINKTLEHIRVSDDGTHFVRANTGKRFVAWGVNYDHDSPGRLIDEYWTHEWETVVEDFKEIKSLGANCVRIHLQLGKFMDEPDKPNAAALEQLGKLVELAEETGLYLDVTGLACYHKQNIPAWYDELDEQSRWKVQARFWEAVAQVCNESPAIYCYDLMNEPILPGNEPATEWLAGELGGKFFVQRLTLDLNGRTREQVAEAWVNTMVDAIRRHDERHMITVGVIPWVFVFGGGKPLFHSPTVGKRLDFVAVHYYPERGQVEKALTSLKAYEVGKPLVIEEMFPLKCSQDELVEFIKKSASHTDGWISFYWGTTPQELRGKDNRTIGDAIIGAWLEKFAELSPTMRGE